MGSDSPHTLITADLRRASSGRRRLRAATVRLHLAAVWVYMHPWRREHARQTVGAVLDLVTTKQHAVFSHVHAEGYHVFDSDSPSSAAWMRSAEHVPSERCQNSGMIEAALAHRIRKVIGDRPNVTEQVPGDGAWMNATSEWSVNARIAIMVRGDGGLLVRVAKDDHAGFGAEPGANPLGVNPRGFGGWIHLEAWALTSDTALATWVERGLEFAETLPLLDDV